MPAPNNFSSRNLVVTVYDVDGNEHETSRPNAKDLVSSGKYFWNRDGSNTANDDVNGVETAEGGTLTIFDANGNEFTVSRANARDLLRAGYTLRNPNSAEAVEAPDEEEVLPPAEPKPTPEAPAVPTADDPLDPVNSTLADIAKRVTGSDDVKAYLETFSDDNLRQMAEERYGEKPHHRASKATVIEKIVELEDAKLSAE